MVLLSNSFHHSVFFNKHVFVWLPDTPVVACRGMIQWRNFSSSKESDVSYEQLKKLLAAGAASVIDVREPWELREYGNIPGSINVPCKIFLTVATWHILSIPLQCFELYLLCPRFSQYDYTGLGKTGLIYIYNLHMNNEMMKNNTWRMFIIPEECLLSDLSGTGEQCSEAQCWGVPGEVRRDHALTDWEHRLHLSCWSEEQNRLGHCNLPGLFKVGLHTNMTN